MKMRGCNLNESSSLLGSRTQTGRQRRLTLCILAGVCLLAITPYSTRAAVGTPEGMEVGFALKEALLIAAETAVSRASADGGFSADTDIRLGLPGGLAAAQETLRRFGLADEVDDLLLQLNRAAEGTAGQALPHLSEAIRDLELADPVALLQAGGSAASSALQTAAEEWLIDRLSAVAAAEAERSGVADAFRQLVDRGGNLVEMAGVSEQQLAPHVASGTVQGLLWLMAAEERAIRTDPAARTTPLLQKVFSSPPAPPDDGTEVGPAGSGPAEEPPPTAASTQASEEDEHSRALTEALRLGVLRAVERASQVDGYFGNSQIHIPLPEKLQKVGASLRDVGLGSLVDELELSMNRAAEQAATEAAPIITDAVSSVTFGDAVAILTGGETAATDALRLKTEDRLTEVLQPVIASTMEETGVSRRYDKLVQRAGPVLMLLGLDAEADLPTYVTGMALDGLFTLLAEEEVKIRRDPVARTTELLKKIFGALD